MYSIGILTTYFSMNYGATLQAYALQKKLNSLGYKAELIRYRNLEAGIYIPKAVQLSISKESKIKKIKRRFSNLLIKMRRSAIPTVYENVRNSAFSAFIDQYIPLSEHVYNSPKEFFTALRTQRYDAYICGSDQIWNPVAHNFDPVYLLNFDTSAKRIAYAPSIAYHNLDDAEWRRISDAVRGIDVLSVRERSAKQMLSKYLDVDIEVMIDPTFLLERNEWIQLDSKLKLPVKYILVYLLNYNENPAFASKTINQYAKENECEIVCLPYTNINFDKGIQCHRLFDVAPNDFIALIKDAVCIFTNSYHATALSININKDFYVFTNKANQTGIQSRIEDLLDILNLQQRGISSINHYLWVTKRRSTE